MALLAASIASGSNGNCYYIGNGREAVLVDAGISCREIEKRMLRLSLSLQKVNAIFVSHEHSDHIRGLEVLSRKHQIPVFINQPTLQNSPLRIEPGLLQNLGTHDEINIGGLQVSAFPKFHDAAAPQSFVISGNGVNVGVFTDIGVPCDHVKSQFSRCHAAFLETNYDDEMLANGRYPFHLKRRIAGDHGHLSNSQALQLFIEHRAPHLRHLFLSHLSKDNNNPDLARKLFELHCGDTQVVVASRYEPTAVHTIAATKGEVAAHYRQATLF